MHVVDAPLPLIRFTAAALVLLFALTTYALVSGNIDAIALASWATSPQLIPLALLFARERWIVSAAAAALMLFWAAAAVIWLAGGMGAIFLPVAEFAFIVALFVAFWFVSATCLTVAGAARLVRRKTP